MHLVHNFKSTQFVRRPVHEWPGVNPGDQPPPTLWPEPPDLLPEPGDVQQHLTEPLGEVWTGKRMGFGVATTSALLSLVKPAEYAIIDRLALTALIGATTGTAPLLGITHPWNPDTLAAEQTLEVTWATYHDSYMPLLREIRDGRPSPSERTIDLRTLELALFLLGAEMEANREGSRTWPAYRDELATLLYKIRNVPTSDTSLRHSRKRTLDSGCGRWDAWTCRGAGPAAH